MTMPTTERVAQKPGIPFLFAQVKDYWSVQREEPDPSNQDMVYSYVEHEVPPTLVQGLGEYLNCFRCF
jgi:hypothetical protein